MKKILKSIVCILVLLCISITPILSVSGGAETSGTDKAGTAGVSDASEASGASGAFTSSVPKIYLEAGKTDEYGVAQQPVSNRGKVGFYIKATSEVNNVKVSWRTRDMSAIASQGDYAKKDTTYTLNGTSSGLLYVAIYNAGVATRETINIPGFTSGASPSPSDVPQSPKDAVTRNFFIEITEIDCAASIATIDYTKNRLIASAGSEYTFNVTKIVNKYESDAVSYFSNYGWANAWRGLAWTKYVPLSETQKEVIYMAKSPNIGDGKRYYSVAAAPSMDKFNEFIKRGYADLYANISADTYEDKTIGYSDNIRVSIVYADNHEYICQYDIEYGGWSSEHTYDMLQMQTSSRHTTSPGKVMLGNTVHRTYKSGKYHYYYLEEWWEVKDPNRQIQVEFWDYEDYDGRYFYDVRVKTMIADTKAPEVKNYYLQQESIKQGDKLGLSVRFSEPVQVVGDKKPVISARINNNARYNADFEYVAGSGTDTLYFEWDPETSTGSTNNIDVTSFVLCDFLNASSIADYSLSMNVVKNPQIFESDDTDSFRGDSSKFTYYQQSLYYSSYTSFSDDFKRHNRLVKPNLNKTIKYAVDLRKPDISSAVRPSESANKYLEVPISIAALNKEGKLYYTWSNSNLYPDEYDNEATNLDDIYTIRASGKNGKFYLYVKAVSAYGKSMQLQLGPFKFDDKPPTIDFSVTGGLTSRTFKLNISDGEEGVDYVSGVGKATLTIAKDAAGTDVAKTYSYDGKEEKLFAKDVTVTAETLGLGKDEYGTYYVFVTAYDALGNKAQSAIEKCKFDRRTFFDAKFTGAETYSSSWRDSLLLSGDDYKIVNIYSGNKDGYTTLNFKVTGITTAAKLEWVVKNADGKPFNLSGGTTSTDGVFGTINVDIPNQNSNTFKPGYYTVSFTATESGTTKYSQEFVFYFTNNMQDEGLTYYEKISNGILLTNDVYQLQSDLSYYYMDKNGNICTEKYGNSAKGATFSSRYQAIEYFKYMEYQDLYPVKIDATQADLLNGRSSPNFLKASGETTVAAANQIWIRYKTATFDKDPSTSQWAYYYYQGDDLTVRQEYLSDNLRSAIGAITERLAKNYVNHTVLAGEGNVNKYNEPYLEKDQIHSGYESVSKTKCGVSFGSDIYYGGDTGIYNSAVTEAGKKYSIATNLEIASNGLNRLFYKSRNNPDAEYTEIDLNKYTNLSEVITASGVYDLLEADKQGARKYSVYIDKDAPVLTAFIQDSEGNIITKEFNKSSDGVTYTTKSFTFGAFDETEKDEYAYVSVWKYLTNKTGELLNVYLRSDLQNNGYVLENGDYHIEVYDRSGNGYSFIVRVSAQDFICETTEKENESLTVTCNREENEILAYEIYLDGELITSKYAKKNRFELSGVYRIYIRDIFNNEYEYEIDFQRAYPTVSWQYYDESTGEYVSVSHGESGKKMRIEKVDETTYKIVTSALLQFRYNDLYSYAFEGSADYSESGISRIVKLNSLSGFTLKVRYEKYSEMPVTYLCEIDDSAPNISVKNEIEVFDYNELKYFEEQLESGSVGDELKYDTISYSKRDALSSYLTSGDTVKSRALKISAMDNYGVERIKVYLNGALLFEETQNFSNIVVSRYGEYKIEAYDIFDNKSEFTFKNDRVENFQYYVDGEEKVSDESTVKYFDSQGNFTKIDYGKDGVRLLLKSDCVFSLKITENGKVTYSAFEISDGKIYFVTYKIAEDGTTRVIYMERSAAIFDVFGGEYQSGEKYVIADKNLCGKAISAGYDSLSNICLWIESDGSRAFAVEGRIKTSDPEPFYFKAELSQEKSDVTIKNRDDDTIKTNQDGDRIKINADFYVDAENLSEKIKSVKVYYSVNGSFDEVLWQYDGTASERHYFTANGLYLIEIRNVYGNVTEYYVLKSVNFMITASAELSDGKKFNYSTEYSGEIYSNKLIYINAYSEDITFEISVKDGENYIDYSGAVQTVQNGITVVKLFENGAYRLVITDEFGNKKRVTAEICPDFSAIDEDIVYGYNEKALKKDEGYTNRQLSIDESKISDEIYYILIVHNDQKTVLLDLISENRQELIADKLSCCIGADGDGEYEVVFRDKYGNKILEKVIHYRNKNNSTLKLSRITRSSAEEFDYDIAEAEEYGFWSNNKLIIRTTATKYELKIDGETVGCPWELSFDSGAEEGNLIRRVSYVDEYGNEYDFEAHLCRQKLELSLPSYVKTIDEDGLTVTGNDISLIVPGNTVCTYSLNGIEKPYKSGEILKQDGTYRFTVKDLAGNVSSLTIKKDTVAEYEMIETATDGKVINGGIICTDKVSFKALNGDSARIKYVFKDGELIEDFNDNKFTGNGKWEIVLADNIGNESYFAFRIIVHKVKEFNYTVPYGYKVTEIWRADGDENPESYMQYVEGEGTVLKLAENGRYTIKMSSEITGLTSSYTVIVDNAKPQIQLVGCSENETTLNDVTISGVKVGDKIEIYKDKKLYKTVEILTSQTDAPTITEGGDYTIVVTNEAGVETSVSFVKKHVPNAPGNVLIIALILLAALVVLIGLIYRQRSKVDE